MAEQLTFDGFAHGSGGGDVMRRRIYRLERWDFDHSSATARSYVERDEELSYTTGGGRAVLATTRKA